MFSKLSLEEKINVFNLLKKDISEEINLMSNIIKFGVDYISYITNKKKEYINYDRMKKYINNLDIDITEKELKKELKKHYMKNSNFNYFYK